MSPLDPTQRKCPMPKLRSALMFSGLFLFLASATGVRAQWNPPNPVMSVEKHASGVVFILPSGVLRVQVCTDSIVRVVYSPAATPPDREDYVVIKSDWPATPWTVQSTDKDISLHTSRMIVTVHRSTGAIDY